MEKKLNLVKLAAPMFISSVFGILLGFIDVFVVSRVSDLAASAVSAAGQVMGIFGIVFSVVCGATSILTAQYLGSGNRKKASEIAVVSIAINTAAGVIISLLVFLLHEQLLWLLGTENELFSLARDYLKIMSCFIFLDAYAGSLNCIMSSHGETKIPMYLSVIGGGANVVLDAVLVLGLCGAPTLGVKGAAYATVIVKIGNAVVSSIVFFRKIEKLSALEYLRRICWQDISSLVKLGVPTVFDSVNYSLTQLIVTSIVFHYLGETDIIARTYLLNIAMFFQLFTNAIANAGQIMVGHSIGAGAYDEAEHIVGRALRIALVSTGVLSIGACLFSDFLFGLFTENEAVIRLGFSLLVANVAVELGRAWNVVVIWGLRGAGDVSVPVLICACVMWIVSVGGSYIAVTVFGCGMLGIWIVFGMDELIRAIIMWFRWKSGKWKKVDVIHRGEMV